MVCYKGGGVVFPDSDEILPTNVEEIKILFS